MFEAAVTLAVARDVACLLHPHGTSGRRPELAGILVAQVDHFAGRIVDRVVRPGGELILTAVPAPRVTAARLGDDEAELFISDDVRPWQRRMLTGVQDGHILAAVFGEAAEPVEEREFRRRQGRGLECAWRCG